MYDTKLDEHNLKLKVWQEWFLDSKYGKYLEYKSYGNIDFCISYYKDSLYHAINFLWAEAKRGRDKDIIESFIQLILTIGKEQSYDGQLPPAFLGAFDCEKIAFVEWHEIQHIFSQNDFNWNVAPSNHESKEFKQLYSELKSLLDSKKMLFYYSQDSAQLKEFIESNFRIDNPHLQKIRINKNNFIEIFQRWLEVVKPSISIDWNLAKSAGIIDADFYLADILSKDNQTLIDKLFVVLRKNRYELLREINEMGLLTSQSATFINNNQSKHKEFWNVYERPPLKQYWDYIISRRDLLVPRDIRERKGSFYTPQIWAFKAQEYLEKTFGENYQDDYYIWDLAAGTGNLLINMTNPRNVFASTIDKSDVNIMQELAMKKSLNLLSEHIFQFDFLNDIFYDKPCSAHLCELNANCKECVKLNKPCLKHTNFVEFKCKYCTKSKMPQDLQEILKDSNKRKKLIIFINPPYAEHGNKRVLIDTKEKPKTGVAKEHKMHDKYKKDIGFAVRELFALFMFRIYKEINGCVLASFSTLKYINSSNFIKFRKTFKAKFLRGFMCPAYTFDNVKGKFPIGFYIWDTSIDEPIKRVKLDIFDDKDVKIGKKKVVSLDNKYKYISNWLRTYYDKKGKALGYIILLGVDMQCSNGVYITSYPTYSDIIQHKNAKITPKNIIICMIYLAIRHCIKHTWINDRDQFLYPNEKWLQDLDFHNDCLAYALFQSQNRISSKNHINHFIPFTEMEVNAKKRFKSDFMYRFINGKIKVSDLDSIESDFVESSFSETNFNKTSAISGKTSAKKDSNIIKIDSIFDRFIPSSPLHFSPEARAVFNAGREIFKYYHAQDFSNLAFHYDDGYDRIYNPNASLYDIKAHFQGFSLDSKGNATKMNPLQKCLDSNYANLANTLNLALDALALNIESKVYEYEFLL